MSNFFKTIRYQKLANWSVSHLLANQFGYNEDFELVSIGDFLIRNKTAIIVDDETIYKRVKIRLYNKGIKVRDAVIGKKIGTKKQFLISKGQFLLSKIDARNGAFGIATEDVDKAIITADFFAYDIDESKIIAQFLVLLTTTEQFQKFAQSASSGTTGRQRMDERKFLDVKIPLPPIPKQKEILYKYNLKIETAYTQEKEIKALEKANEKYLLNTLGTEFTNTTEKNPLTITKFKDLKNWSVKDLQDKQMVKSKKYISTSFENDESLFEEIFRGKSPKYVKQSSKIIINQKCNRWNKIELQHSKYVDEEWYSNIDSKFFTRTGDILINSTGEGTIGRCSFITDDYTGLLYDSHILLLRVNQININPNYLTYYINSLLGQNQINSIKSAIATKQTELGINNLKKMSIILPPIEIQNEIVLTLKSKTDYLDVLKASSDHNRRDAIYEFEGEIFKKS